MTTTTERAPLNGVDTPTLFATLDAVKAQPDIATWDSLRLLTPNWMSRLPMWSYQGSNPEESHLDSLGSASAS